MSNIKKKKKKKKGKFHSSICSSKNFEIYNRTLFYLFIHCVKIADLLNNCFGS